MLDYEFNMGYEQNSKLHVNIYEFKLCIITEKSIITELKKYYTQFVVSNFDSTDLTYYFIIDKMDNLSDKFKKLPGVIEKWSNIFILDEEPKIKCFLIPNKGYPVVLINQIINNFTHDMLTINNIIPFHAGAVSKNKNALLLIGEQRSGKTTLSLSLTNNGYEYFTDDIALIDLKTNEVLPYFAGITPRINTVKMFPEKESIMLDYEFNMGYEQNSKLHVNIYEFKLCIITEKSIITELKKYYTQFVVSNFDSTDLTYYFIIDKMDNLSDKFKKLPGVIEKWSNIFILDEEPKIKCFLIPNKGYPVVLINQIINNFTHDMLTINNIIPFHAGAVSKNKNALLLIGEQRSGKTTLSLSLTNNGYEYFTDDIALIDLKTNEVLPYFAGITPRINTVKMFPELIQNEYSHPYLDFDDNEQRWCIELANLFADKMSKPCKLKYIIFPKFKPDCEFSIKSMDRSTAIVMMMRNMKMIPTLVLGSSSIKTMSKILKNDVDTYYMEYPNRYVAMEFIDTLYKE